MTAAKAEEAPRDVIHDRGYKPWSGKRRRGGRSGLIAGRMLAMTMRQALVIVMIILPVLPTLWYAGATWFKSTLIKGLVAQGAPPDQVIAAIGSVDRYVFDVVGGLTATTLTFLMAMFAGSGAVANDTRAGAFQFYFARPVTPTEYLIGKLVPPVVLTAIVGMVPPLLVGGLRVALARDGAEVLTVWSLPLKGMAIGALEAVAFAIPAVALSSLSRSATYVQGGFAALFLLPWIGGLALIHGTRSAWPGLLSLRLHVYNLGRVLFDLPSEEGDRWLPVWVSAVVLAAIVAGSIALLRKRLDAVEVIAG
jgi:hypothetical protein